jgi:3-methyladenine DNA glycosylase/8-oxoguanine DNA glycosylase
VGERAPGPVDLLLTPSPTRLLEVPSYTFHRLGVERRRAETIYRCAAAAHRLEEAVSLDDGILDRRLRAISGVGVWTSAEVRRIALGDADAVSVGDFHVPHAVAWALAGEARADDARMLELLGIAAPRRGPRRSLRAIVRH